MQKFCFLLLGVACVAVSSLRIVAAQDDLDFGPGSKEEIFEQDKKALDDLEEEVAGHDEPLHGPPKHELSPRRDRRKTRFVNLLKGVLVRYEIISICSGAGCRRCPAQTVIDASEHFASLESLAKLNMIANRLTIAFLACKVMARFARESK